MAQSLTLGLVGGLGPESTIDYYRRIIEGWERAHGPGAPSIVIDSLDVARVTIAHRLSTVRKADRICVLSGGRFVETGSYEELFALGGVFTELAKRQLLGD